jgi:hypothetical protein
MTNGLPTLPQMSQTRHMSRIAAGLVAAATVALLIPSLVADAAPKPPKYVSTAPDLMTPSKMDQGWATATAAWHAQEYQKHRMIDLANLVTISEEIERQEAAAAQARREAAARAAAKERQSSAAPRASTSSPSSSYGAGAAPGPCAGWQDTIAAYFPADQVAKACRVMMCESGGNPHAENPGSSASGLFQFLDSTWESTTGTPAPASAYGGATQVSAAAKLWSSSGWGPWSCA